MPGQGGRLGFFNPKVSVNVVIVIQTCENASLCTGITSFVVSLSTPQGLKCAQALDTTANKKALAWLGPEGFFGPKRW